MFKREISAQIMEAIKKYPVVTLIGPRQSGKTTLCKALFPGFRYISLEDKDIRMMAKEDPRGFFKRFPGSLILDEIQRTPDLTSYIQTLVDDQLNRRRFILTGSHNLLLMNTVSQTLAGRTRIFELLPFSQREIRTKIELSLNEHMWQGGYPRIYDKKLNPTEWLKDYFRLYVERDARSVLKISNLDIFERFTGLIAGRAGQLLNYNSLASETGVGQPTIQSWVSVLKVTFICFTLQPHYRNFNRRIVKTPKLYFYDTGLLCYLLKINRPEMLDSHPLRGNIFENHVISESIKRKHNEGKEPSFYFWRDQKGHETDLVEEVGADLRPVEIRFSETFHKSFLKNIKFLNKLQEIEEGRPIGQIIYASEESFDFQGYNITSWLKL